MAIMVIGQQFSSQVTDCLSLDGYNLSYLVSFGVPPKVGSWWAVTRNVRTTVLEVEHEVG